MTDVVMPRLDPGMQSGKIVEWLKKEGDQVRKGEAILVVEGEKTTFEIEAPDSGVLSKILAQVGNDVQVAEPVAVIGEFGRTSQSEGSSKMIRQEGANQGSMASTQSYVPPVSSSAKAPTTADRIVASPAARRLAQEHHVELATLSGTGPGGRISREDVIAAIEQAPKAAAVASKMVQPSVLRRVKLEGIRKAVAERLSFSARTCVPVTITMEADATKLVAMKEKESHVSFTAFAVKAAAKALEKHAAINSTIEGDEITTYAQVNVAVAIHTEEGLVAPVVSKANEKPLKEINLVIDELSRKAKEKRLSIEELTGGTFTITNLGAYDIESFAPVINPPQCAILGLGRIVYKPFALGGRVSARPSTMLTLVFDHRIVDGVPAARFLQDLKRNLEDPESLL
ncbi:MAG: dihydrolipoamide acetyltransferase family protein [Candidatus Bathyarchaeia archaeon]|jgi:pyruvate dehydrogenase E2 component (dihydrolipoamide acetyltransferase)